MKAALTEEEFLNRYGSVRSTLDLIATVAGNNIEEELAKGTLCNAAIGAMEQLDALKKAFYKDLNAHSLQVAQS